MAKVQQLAAPSDFEALLEASKERPVALLKHSIACPVSARGQKEFVRLEDDGDPDLYVVVVQYARALSNEIADRLGVRHETPQALIIRDGAAVYHTNHYDIKTEDLRAAAQAVA